MTTMEEEQKRKFYELYDEYVARLSEKNRLTFSIDQAKYQKILSALSLEKGERCELGGHFKAWCYKTFKLHKIGSQSVLYCLKNSRPVVCKEDLYDTIKRCHIRVGHSGRTKTWAEVSANYAWIKHGLVLLFIGTCRECATRISIKKPPAGKPIISLGFMTRMQMDLIDFTSVPDGDYLWILHLRDHFSKFSWAFPLKSKRAAGVAECLMTTFSLFGAPRVLQSDNGKEFVAGVIKELASLWRGMTIINGRPRHPQSQGCVERGNGDLTVKLGKWLEANEEKGWVAGLPHIVYAINTSISETTGKSPFEVVYGQPPRTHCAVLEILAQQGIIDEEDVPDMFDGPQADIQGTDTEDAPRATVPSHDLEIMEEDAHEPLDLNTPETSTADVRATTSDVTDEAPVTFLPPGSEIWEDVQQDIVLEETLETSENAEEALSVTDVRSTTTSENDTKDHDKSLRRKRGKEFNLLHEERVVARGIEIFGHNTVHGQRVDRTKQSVIQLIHVAKPAFTPLVNNPFEEPLSEGAFTLWEKENILPTESDDTPHAKVRKIATCNYLKAANKQVNFDAKEAHLEKSFNVGDTVGIRIHEVDRTNTGARLLPCKILSVEQHGSETFYKVYTNGGLLKNKFKAVDMVDLRNVHFSQLQNVDVESLSEISVIKASRIVTHWTAKGSTACSCRGKCHNRKCKCKRAGLPCLTKCHPQSTTCTNTSS
ncbi:hypothetical protein V1264_004638 [Littorina saxatilis]|uniref:Integrase catalytic domain-containing protein n=2 Tax=Littorina saxatilis TaxID=31220 RepID=A0AAN9G8G2_9CAEN